MESNDEIKEYDRIIKETIEDGLFEEQEERFECDILDELNIINETTNLYETEIKSENLYSFNVYFCLKINDKIKDIFLIESDELNIDTQCVSDLISNIVKKINSKKIKINYENNEFILLLKEYDNNDFYYNNYELRSCDKMSHNPVYDCPCFSPTLMLDELISQDICFIVKKTNNIILLEKFENEKLIVRKSADNKYNSKFRAI